MKEKLNSNVNIFFNFQIIDICLGSFLKDQNDPEKQKWNHDKFEITLRSPSLTNVNFIVLKK